MKKSGIKLLVGALLITLIGGTMVGCGSNSTDSDDGGQTSLTLSGSSALLPLVEATIDGFKQDNSQYDINAQAGGSGTGLTQVSDGSVDVGNSDIFANEKLDDAAAKELTDNKVVVCGFSVAVSKDLGVKNLTKDQIKSIFSGKITNWKDVGGPDKAIFVVHRPASSGTRATFTTTLLDKDKTLEKDAIGATQDSNGAVLTAMTQNEGSISYLAFSYMTTDEAKNKIVGVSIDGVEPTKDNITTGKYPFWSWEHMYTKGETTGLAKKFIDYLTSDKNKDNIEKLGFISSSEMKVK